MSAIFYPQLHYDYEDPYSLFNWYSKDTVTTTIPTGSITNSDITLYLDALQLYTIMWISNGLEEYSMALVVKSMCQHHHDHKPTMHTNKAVNTNPNIAKQSIKETESLGHYK